MILLLTILHLFVCVFLILVVLLQTGKGADVAAAFGGTSQTAFGARGAAPLLSKLTTGSGRIFRSASCAPAILANRPSTSAVVTDEPTQQSAPAPAPAPSDTPQTPPPPPQQ